MTLPRIRRDQLLLLALLALDRPGPRRVRAGAGRRAGRVRRPIHHGDATSAPHPRRAGRRPDVASRLDLQPHLPGALHPPRLARADHGRHRDRDHHHDPDRARSPDPALPPPDRLDEADAADPTGAQGAAEALQGRPGQVQPGPDGALQGARRQPRLGLPADAAPAAAAPDHLPGDQPGPDQPGPDGHAHRLRGAGRRRPVRQWPWDSCLRSVRAVHRHDGLVAQQHGRFEAAGPLHPAPDRRLQHPGVPVGRAAARSRAG